MYVVTAWKKFYGQILYTRVPWLTLGLGRPCRGVAEQPAAFTSIHQIGDAGSVDDYLILLNSMVDTCILEQVEEHSNRRAALFRLTLKRLVDPEFAVLSLRSSMGSAEYHQEAHPPLTLRSDKYETRCACQ